MSRTKRLLSKGCKIPQSIPKIRDLTPFPNELSEQPGGAQTPGTHFCTQKSLIQEQMILKTSDTQQEDEVTLEDKAPVLCGKPGADCGAGTAPRFTRVLWNVLGGSERPLHGCLIPHQDFWDTPALLVPRIPSSREEPIPESGGAAREAPMR